MSDNKEKLNLTPKDFSFICPLNMDELTPIKGGYHCDSCEKKVYDVSHMTVNEFQTLQEKTKDLCISFKKVTTVAVALSVSGWVAADDNISKDTTYTPAPKCQIGIGRIKGKPKPIIKNTFKYGVKGKIRQTENTFELGKVKVIPHDANETNSTNALTPPIKCDIETRLDGDNIAPSYEEKNSN